MKLTPDGKVTIGGREYDNPLDRSPYPKKDYSEGMASARISFKSIWIDSYPLNHRGEREFWSCEMRLLSNGKAFIDNKEIKSADDVETVKEIFKNLKVA